MHKRNIEIKASSNQHEKIRALLLSLNADFIGKDHQVDTYFKVPHGRLKLREGTIENNLIHYLRGDQAGPKQSNVILYKSQPNSSLKSILETSLGIMAVVDKQREIYFIENIKFHIDTVNSLGTFVEIEAIDSDGSNSLAKLQEQCNHYMDLFEIQTSDLVSVSYSDMIMEKLQDGTEK